MKSVLLSITLFIIISFSNGQSFELEIINGYGSGTYNEGDTIHIWSNPTSEQQVFTQWTGPAKQFLEFSNEWHTILVIPVGTGQKKMKLTANLENLPSGILSGEDKFPMYGIDTNLVRVPVEKSVYYRIPPHPKAVVLLFHGTNGSGTSYFTRYERIQLMKDFLYNGYAVFGLNCNERTLGDVKKNDKIQWVAKNAGEAEPENNIDLENVKETIARIYSTHEFSEDLPMFSFGVSNGANFSDLVAAVFDLKASAHVTASGRDGTYHRDDVAPVIWIMSENDHQEQADNPQAYKNYKQLLKTHSDSEFHVFKRSPMFPERFQRNNGGVSEAKSLRWFNKLEDLNLLDDENYLSNLIVETFIDDFIDEVEVKSKEKKGIKDQLMCVNADHTLSADYNKNIIRFFDAQLQKTTSLSFDDEIEINVFPNPTTDFIYVKTKVPNGKYQMYNSKGQLILKGFLVSTQIDVSKLPSDIYFLKIMDSQGNQIQFAKVIVSRDLK